MLVPLTMRVHLLVIGTPAMLRIAGHGYRKVKALQAIRNVKVNSLKVVTSLCALRPREAVSGVGRLG